MGHTPYGYRIVNGKAVVDETEGAAVKKLYEGYLGGLGLLEAARTAGIPVNHCQAKRMMLNEKYIGTDYYPAIITADTMAQFKEELAKRANKLGRVYEPKVEYPRMSAMKFSFGKETEKHTDPIKQAEYRYSLIEGVMANG